MKELLNKTKCMQYPLFEWSCAMDESITYWQELQKMYVPREA